MTLHQQVRFDHTIKVILLGDHEVDKSGLLTHIADCHDHGKTHVTCLDLGFNSHVEMDVRRHGKRILLKVISTGGQERFRSITASFYRGAQGCFLMFDAENVDTFRNVSKWHYELEMYTCHQPISTFLIGLNPDSNKRQVQLRKAESLATELGIQYHPLLIKGKHSSCIEILDALMDRVLHTAARIPSLTIDILPVNITQQCTEEKRRKFQCAC